MRVLRNYSATQLLMWATSFILSILSCPSCHSICLSTSVSKLRLHPLSARLPQQYQLQAILPQLFRTSTAVPLLAFVLVNNMCLTLWADNATGSYFCSACSECTCTDEFSGLRVRALLTLNLFALIRKISREVIDVSYKTEKLILCCTILK
jgi:hypothetical protein